MTVNPAPPAKPISPVAHMAALHGRPVIGPQSGRQESFLSSPADIVIYGGSAGGGKTFGLLLEPLRHVRNPLFFGLIFRRTLTQVKMEGGLWDESVKLYPYAAGTPRPGNTEWLFPSGSTIRFGHLGSDQTLLGYQGSQIPFIGFDQLEHFSERQFWYMLSRNRSLSGVRGYVRATVNPDPDCFVAKLIEWWIDQDDGYAILERSGVIRWFARIDEKLEWDDSAEALTARLVKDGVPAEDISPKSFTFIPATIYDNPMLMARDPGYLANLKALPLIDRQRLLGDRLRGGNWKIKVGGGKLFNRTWFPTVPAAPAGGIECRFFDFAATEAKISRGKKLNDPDFTAGTKIRYVNGLWYVMGFEAFRVGPAEIDRRFLNIVTQDVYAAKHTGTTYMIRWETEPGSASIRENRRIAQMLAHLAVDCGGRKPDGDKITRAKAFASQAEAGNIILVEGDWNQDWLDHMHNQPDLPHDDVMDSSTGSFNELTVFTPRPARSHQG